MHDVARQLRELAHRDAQIRVRVAGGVGESRLFQPDLPRALGQQGGESRLVAGHAFGERDAGVIGGIDDDAVQQVVYLHAAVDRRIHGRAVRRRPALAPRVFADEDLVLELESALLDLVEGVFQRHQLGEARRRHELVAVLLEQDAVAFGIHQDGVGDAGLEGLVLFRRHARRGMSGGDDGCRRQHAAGERVTRPPEHQHATLFAHGRLHCGAY